MLVFHALDMSFSGASVNGSLFSNALMCFSTDASTDFPVPVFPIDDPSAEIIDLSLFFSPRPLPVVDPTLASVYFPSLLLLGSLFEIIITRRALSPDLPLAVTV